MNEIVTELWCYLLYMSYMARTSSYPTAPAACWPLHRVSVELVSAQCNDAVTCSKDTSHCRTRGCGSDPDCARSRAGPLWRSPSGLSLVVICSSGLWLAAHPCCSRWHSVSSPRPHRSGCHRPSLQTHRGSRREPALGLARQMGSCSTK